MFLGILHSLIDTLPGILENEVVSSWMVREESGNVIDFVASIYPTVCLVALNILQGINFDPFVYTGHGEREQRNVGQTTQAIKYVT